MSAKKKTPVTRPRFARGSVGALDFAALVKAIQRVHEDSAAAVNRAVNTTLTLRNWIIGGYIHHYELNGQDRAKYGDELLARLAERLEKIGLRRMDERELRRYRAFYLSYPLFRETLSPEFTSALLFVPAIRETASPQFALTGKKLVDSLSFSHFAELIEIEDPLKRAFYEIECIRGNWSVRALKRQIATLYFERSGLSKDKEKLAAMVLKGVEASEPKLAIRDPYIFEFLGQLNTYVTWYRKHMMSEGDNPPLGLLLCTDKDHALVQYATASMDNQLFVSKYAVELPSKAELEKFLHGKHLEMLGEGNNR